VDLEAVYFASQVIAAVALVGSLLFVGVQLRLSRKMERASAQREILVRVADWHRMVYRGDNSAYDTYLAGLRDYDNAPALTQMHLEKCLSEYVFICESALNMRKDGFFSEGTWIGIEEATLGMLTTRGGAQWWRYGREYIGKEIVDHIDARLKDIENGAKINVQFAPSGANRIAELAVLAAEADAAAKPEESSKDQSEISPTQEAETE